MCFSIHLLDSQQLIAGIVPYLGDLLDKSKTGIKRITRYGWVFGICISISFILGPIKSFSDSKKDAQKEKVEAEVRDKVSSIETQVDTAKQALRQQIQSLDSLNAKLNSSTASVLKSIKTTEQAVAGFDRVSEQLRRATEAEKSRIEERKPKLIVDESYFEERDTVLYKYSIVVPIKNNGERIGYNFDVKALILMSLNGKIVQATKTPAASTPGSTISPFEKIGAPSTASFGINLTENIKSERYSSEVYVVAQASCIDSITNRPCISPLTYHTWKSYKENGYKFFNSSNREYKLIEAYMKANNIKL